MLGRSIDATLRNLSTLAILCAIFLAPLHLVFAFANQDALTVREMAPAIEDFPEARQVRGVGRAQLDRERIGRWILMVAVIGTIPFLLAPTRRVLAADANGEIPTALGALRGGLGIPRPAPDARTVVGGGAVALGVIVLVEASVWILVPMLPDTIEWVGVALGQTTARSLGLPFLTTALVIGSRTSARERSLDLY
jgi:hypothetical protein